MGGAVSINSEFRKDNAASVFELFNSKKTTKKMFEQVAAYGQKEEGMRGNADKIDLAELLLFITKEVNPEFTDAFVKNTMVIKQAYNFSMGAKKGEDMDLKQFKKLIPALLLFSHLWHIFESADDNVSDGCIFMPEFMRAKQQILDGKIEGVTMSPISDEDWAKEFDVINSAGKKSSKGKGKRKGKANSKKTQEEGDDYISFPEFVSYTLKNIIKPAVYIAGCGNKEESTEGEEGGGEGGREGPSAFVRMMSGLIDDMEENALNEEEQEKALAELEKEEEDVEGEGLEKEVVAEVVEKNTDMATTDTTTSGADEGGGKETEQNKPDDNKPGTAASAFVDEAIKSNQVTIFSKSYCPYCVETKNAFAGLENIVAKVYELDEMDTGDAIQDALVVLTGQSTVPCVFVAGKHIGGNDDTQLAFKTGTIKEMLGPQ